MAAGSHSAEMPTKPKRRIIDARDQQQAQHAATVSLIVKNTGKIQKEIGFRRARLKTVYQKCGETIDVLNNFKDVAWPPVTQPIVDMNGSNNTHHVVKGNDGDLKPTDTDFVPEPAESSDGLSPDDMSTTVVANSVGSREDDENSIENGVSNGEEGELDASMDEIEDTITTLEDDMTVNTVVGVEEEEIEEDGDQIHPEVALAMECYCMVLQHAQASAKMVEISLECIGLLITNRYLMGSTSPNKMHQTKEGFNKEPYLMELIHKICDCADNSSDAVQSAMTKDLLSLMTSPVCDVHESGMLKAVRTVFHVYLITKHDEVKQLSREVLLDMLRSVFQRMEAYDAVLTDEVDKGPIEIAGIEMSASEEDAVTNNIFASRYHTDSYLLFRALCKLSAKVLPEDAEKTESASTASRVFSGSKSASDPMATSTKILSLELILSVFEHCGPAFCNGPKFIYAVQNLLCVSLLKNCVSSDTRVAHLSLQVFLLLVYKFKNHLKAEIEVFIANVFLPVLESPNCPFERKSLVLEALRALCADPVILTSIFLNYDCDFDAVNLYKTIIQHLTSLSVKGRSTTSVPQKPLADNFTLSVAGLEVLVVILQGFLKALNLPGGDDTTDERNSKAKVRGSLTLDVAMAMKNEGDNVLQNQGSREDMIVTAKEIENMENAESDRDLADKIVDAYDKKRAAQQNFELGSIKFKLSGKQGLLFFIQNGLLRLDAKEIAAFFFTHKETLDKTQIGEIFGREPQASFIKDKGVDPEKGGEGFYIRVLHHYVDGLDFKGLKFDDAIRLFLSGFRLPGESQKVDRVMEKFAERFTLQNETVFPSADTAFILAFAVIMLQTDLHNPNIKPEKKLNEDTFVKMNKGISVDGGDLPRDFLIDIFKSIKERPFTLKEDEDARKNLKKLSNDNYNDTFFGNGAEERRRQRFQKESAEMVESTEKLFKKNKSSSLRTTDLTSSVGPGDVVKPMFDITWGPLLGALSQILEKADDESSIALCLNGFVYSVRVAQHTNTALARSTFVNSLAKFTALGSIRELKPRNIESIRTLLSIAIMDGEHLSDSWRPILQCISQLRRLLFFASGVDSNDEFLNSEKQVSKLSLSTERETEEMNGRVVLEAINEVLIEKVFTSSTKLSDNGIMNLLDSLVLASMAEIEGDSKKDISGMSRSADVNGSNSNHDGPRVYSLQKLVEVADYNMNSRSRLSWAKMWGVMGNHFVQIGTDENAMVSIFAIDALRQLSFKFLQKPELTDFNFQGLFLQPFLSIMCNRNTLEDTRELILQCVDNLTRTYAHNIRSGWKIFFAILGASVRDTSVKNSNLGMMIVQRLVDERLDCFCIPNDSNKTEASVSDGSEVDSEEVPALTAREQNSLSDDFVGLCQASLAFLINSGNTQLPMDLTMRALCHIACYADKIADGSALPPLNGAQSNDPHGFGYTYEGLDPEEGLAMVLWRPIIDGLCTAMRTTASSAKGAIGSFVQRGSVITLRAILLRHGQKFSSTQWKAIMNQAILPAMEKAVKSDITPVINIISESPHISNLDFLVEPLQLPPAIDDAGLLAFRIAAQKDTSAPSRPLGRAELLVEASFADLKHGGSGDLSKTHTLLNKEAFVEKNIEEPFPDSWVATVAPIALGMLTDVFCCIVLNYEITEARELYDLTMKQMKKWALGTSSSFVSVEDLATERYCEALVRIGCNEISHLSETVFALFPAMEEEAVKMWLGFLCEHLAEVLSYDVELEDNLYSNMKAEIHRTGNNKIENQKKNKILSQEGCINDEGIVETLYGMGTVVGERDDEHGKETVKMSIIRLQSNATVFGQLSNILKNQELETTTDGEATAEEVIQDVVVKTPKKEMMKKYISPLRVRCTSIYCVMQSFFKFLDLFSTRCTKKDLMLLVDALESSRVVASKASVDRTLSTYFEEVMRMEWGDRVEEPQAAFSSNSGVGHQGRSEIFFLTQEASANNVLIRLLSLLYRPRTDSEQNGWDTISFAEPLLMTRIIDVLSKFIVSEKENGHKIDPNVWRAARESGGKFAVHCTSFAGIVFNILYTMLRFSDEQFDRRKAALFPILCSLISIQSEEIRMLVAEVLDKKVSVLLGIPSGKA